MCGEDLSNIHHNSSYRMALHLIESAMAYFGDFERTKIYELEAVCEVLAKQDFEAFDVEVQMAQESDKALLGAFFGLFLAYMQ